MLAKAEKPVEDQFTFFYAIWCILFLLSFFAGTAWALNGFLLFNLFIFTPIFLLILIIILIKNLWKKRWLRTVSLILAVVIVPAIFMGFAKIGITPYRIRYELTKSYYNQQMAKVPLTPNKARYKEFDWGSIGTALTSTDIALVYNESDTWPESYKNGMMDTTLTSYGDHFYLMQTNHP